MRVRIDKKDDKVSYRYDFTLPDEVEDEEILKNALENFLAVEEVRAYIRGKFKYGADITAQTETFLEEIRRLLPEMK